MFKFKLCLNNMLTNMCKYHGIHGKYLKCYPNLILY